MCHFKAKDKYNLKYFFSQKVYKLFVLIKMNAPTSAIPTFATLIYVLKYFHFKINAKFVCNLF